MKYYLLTKTGNHVVLTLFDDVKKEGQSLFGKEIQDMKTLDDFPWGFDNIDKCDWEDLSKDAGKIDSMFYDLHAETWTEYIDRGYIKVLDYRIAEDGCGEDEWYPQGWGGLN